MILGGIMTKAPESLSRRAFIQASGLASGAAMLGIGGTALLTITETARAARDAGTAFKVLGAAEARDLAAIAARVIPTTDTPGANEAGVIHFFDRAFDAEMSPALGPVRGFIDILNTAAGGGRRFADLDEAAQDTLLEQHEDDDRFEICRIGTLFGFFGMSTYGGNRDHLSWKLIGFEGHRGAWEAPFGYYDAHYAQEGAHDE